MHIWVCVCICLGPVTSPYKITEYTHERLTGTSVWQYRLLERLGTRGYYIWLPVSQRIAWLYSDLTTVHFVAHQKCNSLHGFNCWLDSSLLKGFWVTLSCFYYYFHSVLKGFWEDLDFCPLALFTLFSKIDNYLVSFNKLSFPWDSKTILALVSEKLKQFKWHNLGKTDSAPSKDNNKFP